MEKKNGDTKFLFLSFCHEGREVSKKENEWKEKYLLTGLSRTAWWKRKCVDYLTSIVRLFVWLWYYIEKELDGKEGKKGGKEGKEGEEEGGKKPARGF